MKTQVLGIILLVGVLAFVSSCQKEEENTEQVKETTTEVNCPEVFRVQLLASRNPVKDKVAQFKGITYQVDEIVLSQTEKFKYKYTVGKECDKEKANEILAEVKKAGFTKPNIHPFLKFLPSENVHFISMSYDMNFITGPSS